jgi:hypothetical protein
MQLSNGFGTADKLDSGWRGFAQDGTVCLGGTGSRGSHLHSSLSGGLAESHLELGITRSMPISGGNLPISVLQHAWGFPIHAWVSGGTPHWARQTDSLVLVRFGSGIQPALQGILPFPGPLAEQHTFDTDILVQIRPVNADSIADQPPVSPFLRRPVQQTRVPGQRNRVRSGFQAEARTFSCNQRLIRVSVDTPCWRACWRTWRSKSFATGQ